MSLRALCCLLPVLSAGLSATPAPIPDVPENFDIILLVGQSNMAGRGTVHPEDRQPDPHIYVLDRENTWANQGEPIHFDKSFAGVGPGFTFAKQVVAHGRPDLVVGLVPCAVGGTPIRRWKPEGDLFQAAVIRAKIAMQKGTLRAILWHQGESECGNETRAKAYGDDLEEVATAFRKALNAPEVPFIAGELGDFLSTRNDARGANARLIIAGIRSLPNRIPYAGEVSAEGLTDRGDSLHFNTDSQKEFGKRYYQVFSKLVTASSDVAAP